VEAFSDGVFAIAITLLILELKVPPLAGDATLGPRLARQWPSYVAFLTSFATIGIMWMNHHRLFTLIRRVDHGLLVTNGLVLLGATIVPFPTALVAAYLGHPGQNLAATVYSATFLFIALAYNILFRYASSERRRPRLLRGDPTEPDVVAIRAQYRFGPVFYAVAVVLSLKSAVSAIAVNLALALFFALPPRGGAGES